jgi:hypothetical protein
MTRLTQVQDAFQDYLLRGATDIERHVVGTERVPIETRLRLYGGAYGARLTEALQTNFPALAQLLGESDFEELAVAYIRSHDSSFPSIRYYGHELQEFLTREPAYAEIPLLAELACWEWAMTETFDAADAQPVEAEAMSQVPPDQWAQLRFEWHPSIRRVQLLWNVPQLWKAITKETERPEPSVSAEAGQWLLWRRDLETYFRSMSSSEATAMDAARDGSSFGELCDRLCQWEGEAAAPAKAAEWLRDWLQSGMIVTLAAVGDDRQAVRST